MTSEQMNLMNHQLVPCAKCGIMVFDLFEGGCFDCETERHRMEEFDRLIEADDDIRAVWEAFHRHCEDMAWGGMKKMSAIPMLYRTRTAMGIECSNSLAPMLARKFNKISGHPFFKLKRLGRK